MFVLADKPSLVSLVGLRERVARARDKAQASGMGSVSATLLECFEILSLLTKESSLGLFRGEITRVRLDEKRGFLNLRLVNKFINSQGKLRRNNVDVYFDRELNEQEKSLKVGDEIACDGKLQATMCGTQIRVWHVEILKRGEPTDGNVSA